MYKICSKCKEEKLLSEFSKNKCQKDGYNNKCKSCVKVYKEANKKQISEYNAKYYECNKDRIIAQHVEYYVSNNERILINAALYRENNKEKISVKNAEYRRVNKERISLQYVDYYQANKDKISAAFVEYRKINGEKIACRMKEYRQTNKDKINAQNAERRAAELQATPPWLTKFDKEQIVELYTIAQMFKLYTGEEYHVDHIVPLKGKTVCGLHVPWNLQVIPAKENLSKSNKLLPD
jgi:hypothetical protein